MVLKKFAKQRAIVKNGRKNIWAFRLHSKQSFERHFYIFYPAEDKNPQVFLKLWWKDLRFLIKYRKIIGIIKRSKRTCVERTVL